MALSHLAVASDGVGVALGEVGIGDGAAGRGAVVMAHATGFCGEVLAPVAAGLGADWRCVAFDERGHGRSGQPPPAAKGTPGWQRWAWQGFGADVLAVVDWLGASAGDALGVGGAAVGGAVVGGAVVGGAVVGGPVVGGPVVGGPVRNRPPIYGFGHSAGATAILLAEIARRGTFSAIYAFEPVVFRPALGALDTGTPLAAMTRRRREVFGSRAEAYASFASKPPFSAFDLAALLGYLGCGFEELDDGGVRLRCRRDDEAHVYEAGLRHDAWDHLDEIACPVTVAYGTLSDFMDATEAGALASRLRRGRAEAIPGVGHFGPMERPGEVAASVSAAFAEFGVHAAGHEQTAGSDHGAGSDRGAGSEFGASTGSVTAVRDGDTPVP